MEATALTMLGVNVGIGFVYYALPAARYREKLFGGIVESLKREGNAVNTKEQPSDVPAEKGWLATALTQDKALADSYHCVAKWLGEMPRRFGEETAGTIADLVVPSKRPIGLPRRYTWFKRNLDKWVCLALCTVLPILLLWAEHTLAWAGYGTVASWIPYGPLALLGQACVVGHVWQGNRMVSKNVAEFQGAVDALVVVARQAEVTDALAE